MSLRASMSMALDVRVTTARADQIDADNYKTGTTLRPAIATAYTLGTSARQALVHYYRMHTIDATDAVTIDMNAAEKEDGAIFNFATVRWVFMRIRTPGAGVELIVGNAASNPWAPWLSSATATEELHHILYRESPYDGWAVPSAANLKIANNTAASINVDVSILGY